jgi:hypothetical protein
MILVSELRIAVAHLVCPQNVIKTFGSEMQQKENFQKKPIALDT